MSPNPQLSHLLKKSLMENFIFYEVFPLRNLLFALQVIFAIEHEII